MKNEKEDDNNNTKTKRARKEASDFTCEICTESKPIDKMFKNENGSSSSSIIKCNTTHDPFCLDCIANHIIAKLDENIANVKCPSLICDQMIDPLLCDKILPKGLFKKWCDLLCHEALEGYKKCECPNKECLQLVIDECGDSNNIRKFGCPSCKKLFCFNCKVPWHECKEEEEEEEEKNEKLFLKLVNEKKWCKCPGCNYYVELRVGCNHIRCRYLPLTLFYSFLRNYSMLISSAPVVSITVETNKTVIVFTDVIITVSYDSAVMFATIDIDWSRPHIFRGVYKPNR